MDIIIKASLELEFTNNGSTYRLIENTFESGSGIVHLIRSAIELSKFGNCDTDFLVKYMKHHKLEKFFEITSKDIIKIGLSKMVDGSKSIVEHLRNTIDESKYRVCWEHNLSRCVVIYSERTKKHILIQKDDIKNFMNSKYIEGFIESGLYKLNGCTDDNETFIKQYNLEPNLGTSKLFCKHTRREVQIERISLNSINVVVL